MMKKGFSLFICLIIFFSLIPSSYAVDGTTSITFISSKSLEKEIPDWDSSCRLACTTMALNTLGIDVKAKEIWELNGATSFMYWSRVAKKYNVTISKEITLSGNKAEKEQKLKDVLHSLPDTHQFLLVSVKAKFIVDGEVKEVGHMVIMFADQMGNLKIHDPGVPYGDNTTIEETYMMAQYGTNDEKWKNVTDYITIKHKDQTPPVITNEPWVAVQNDSRFTIGFGATDSDTGIKEVYARIAYDSLGGESGKPSISSEVCSGSFNGETATITVNASDYAGQLKNFWFTCSAKDYCGNEAVATSDLRAVSLYPLTISGKKDCGRFKTIIEDAPLCIIPYEEYGGKDMVSVRVSKGYDNLYVAGKHVNEQGETWYFVEPNLWIKSDYVSRKSNDGEIWAKVGQYVNYEFFCVGGSYVPAENSVETQIRTYKSANIAEYTDDEEPIEEKPVYTVSFDACGGYCGRPNYSVTYESQYGELPVPIRKGYRFDGWFTHAENGIQITSSDTYNLNEAQTLYAHWTRIVLEQGICGENLSYILYGDGQLDISGSGAMSSAPWTADHAARVETVSLPEGLTSLCAKAFDGCTCLVAMNYPESLAIIGDWAFRNCVLLETVHLPANLSQLGFGAFHNCESIEEINIPSTVTTKELTGENVEYYQGPFLGCTSLSKITIEEGITTIPEGLFTDCVMTEITLPSTVTSIATKAFARCGDLVSVTFPEGLQTIGQNAFRDCVSIEEVHLPAGLTMLDLGVFTDCTSLHRVNIPNNVKTGKLAGDNVEYYRGPFVGCTSLDQIVFDEGITTIPEGLFADCVLTEITLPSTVTSIAPKAFARCANLVSIAFPEALQSIGKNAFRDCVSIEEVQLPLGFKKLDLGAFCNCTSLAKVNVPKNIATGNLAGYNDYYRGPYAGCTSLIDVTFDTGITSIPEGLFAESGVTEIVIPPTVTKIANRAFKNCADLTSVTIPPATSSIASDAFSYYDRMTIYGEAGTYAETYAAANNITFVPLKENVLMLPAALTTIEAMAFQNSDIQNVVIGINVRSIESEAFADCRNLRVVEFSNSSVTIANDAFDGSNVTIIAPGGGTVQTFALEHGLNFVSK